MRKVKNNSSDKDKTGNCKLKEIKNCNLIPNKIELIPQCCKKNTEEVFIMLKSTIPNADTQLHVSSVYKAEAPGDKGKSRYTHNTMRTLIYHSQYEKDQMEKNW